MPVITLRKTQSQLNNDFDNIVSKSKLSSNSTTYFKCFSHHPRQYQNIQVRRVILPVEEQRRIADETDTEIHLAQIELTKLKQCSMSVFDQFTVNNEGFETYHEYPEFLNLVHQYKKIEKKHIIKFHYAIDPRIIDRLFDLHFLSRIEQDACTYNIPFYPDIMDF
jgi:hypothetical protein